MPSRHWAVLAAALCIGALPAAADPADPVFGHLQALQAIADANGGNRAAGRPGYDRSADYVAARLREAGYDVRFEEFTFPFFEERSPPVLVAGPASSPAREVRTFGQSASGDVTAPLRAVDLGVDQDGVPPASTSGCEASDFDGFPRGAIALMRRGTCTFEVKVGLAAAAGAAGAVIMNEGTAGKTDIYAGQANKSAIPVVSTSFESGRALATVARDERQGIVRLAVDVASGMRSTRNVIAELNARPSGGETIVVGAHLDSVPEGPGINDNGSGSAAVLETALRLAASAEPETRHVQFAFWGAEELGLLGSRHHVSALSSEERQAIKLYVNLDMVASPNYSRLVQGTAGETGSLVATASQVMLDTFALRGLPVDQRTTSGGRRTGFGTDDSSFAQAGIPTVGLYTGAGETKSADAAARFGGAAGQPYDACYHKACDTVGNIARDVLAQMTDALTHTLTVLTRDAH
jgi:Zn-dependent M28 family amino/carboxypeptidase